MHELGITQSIVAIVAEHAAGRPVKRVVVEIGTLAGVMADAVQFCFDTVVQGTPLEGAVLEIRRIEARARCGSCGTEFSQAALFSPCPCGSHVIERLSGEELNVKEYEIAEAAPERRAAEATR
jgi:hydrogenase nickel incorporation protein HypA/HybF